MKHLSKTSKLKLLILVFVFLAYGAAAQTPTVGLIQQDTGTTEDGYMLFMPLSTATSYLTDKCGKVVHTWNSAYKPGNSGYLLQDGVLLRAGISVNSGFGNVKGTGGIIQKIDWDGNVLWSYLLSDSMYQQHHDIKPMPNGHILALAWEKKTPQQATDAGRNPVLSGPSIWSEAIFELEPVGTNQANIVWEWHMWDHLVQDYDNTKPNYGTVSNNPGLLNLNYTPKGQKEDWLHANAIDYNPALDQVLINSPYTNEFYIIDHSTTTAEAASHNGGIRGKGGDFLYRWGNPYVYGHGTVADQKLFFQHTTHWIPPGFPYENQIMIFNNGQKRPGGSYSTVDIINPAINTGGIYDTALPYGPSGYTWSYNQGNPNNLYSDNVSGAQQLKNGNVTICVGNSGQFIEVNPNKQMVWKYINPESDNGIIPQGATPSLNSVFRTEFIPASYPGLAGHTLVPGNTIENENILSADCDGLPLMSITDANIPEGNTGTSSAYFTVSLDKPSANTVTVKYNTKSGTAVAPSDFSAANLKLIFAPGETSKVISISINGDTNVEADETFRLTLSKIVNAVLADSSGRGKILNDDMTPGTVAENNNNNVYAYRQITIYPNPVTSVLNIGLPETNVLHTITVTDITGRTINLYKVNSGDRTFTMNTALLSKGIYILHVTSGKENFTTRFVKQ